MTLQKLMISATNETKFTVYVLDGGYQGKYNFDNNNREGVYFKIFQREVTFFEATKKNNIKVYC